MATILNLSPRLEAIVNLCDKVKVIADIGCDHGYISAELVLQERADKVIATDISAKCLNKAILLCDSMNIAYFVSFREGDGFEVITKRDKVKQAVIAGMGGREIISILEKRPKKLFDFVLQPQSDIVLLRQYLVENGFDFVVDTLVKENNKYYNVIKVTKAKKAKEYNPLEIYFGKTNFRENYQMFYEYLVERFLALYKLKYKFGELNRKNEEEWYYVNEALKLFGVDSEQLIPKEYINEQAKTQEVQEGQVEQESANEENVENLEQENLDLIGAESETQENTEEVVSESAEDSNHEENVYNQLENIVEVDGEQE